MCICCLDLHPALQVHLLTCQWLLLWGLVNNLNVNTPKTEPGLPHPSAPPLVLRASSMVFCPSSAHLAVALMAPFFSHPINLSPILLHSEPSQLPPPLQPLPCSKAPSLCKRRRTTLVLSNQTPHCPSQNALNTQRPQGQRGLLKVSQQRGASQW